MTWKSFLEGFLSSSLPSGFVCSFSLKMDTIECAMQIYQGCLKSQLWSGCVLLPPPPRRGLLKQNPFLGKLRTFSSALPYEFPYFILVLNYHLLLLRVVFQFAQPDSLEFLADHVQCCLPHSELICGSRGGHLSKEH